MLEKGDVITLEDNIEYTVIDKIIVDTTPYYLFINPTNTKDMFIRKELLENSNVVISGLDSEQEYNSIIKLFKKRNSLK